MMVPCVVQPAMGPGDDVRALGSDIAAGEVVLAAGSLLGAAEIGLLATVGCATVKVHFLFPPSDALQATLKRSWKN